MSETEYESSAARDFLMSVLPILPAWLLGAFALLTTPKLWEAVDHTPLSGPTTSYAPVRILIINIILSSLLYVLAPRLGPFLTSVAPSYGASSPRASSGPAAEFGTVVLRGLALVSIYLVTIAIWRE